MAMRLQEVHPSLVHFPIAFLPTTIICDTLGRITGSRTLLRVGKWGMALTAGSAALAGVFGLIAQEEVEIPDAAKPMLTTHRNLNMGFLGMATVMAARRFQRRAPSARYLLAAMGGLGAVIYSAYLGGHMVYGHGVGVSPAGGVRDGHGPELVGTQMDAVARHAAHDAKAGLKSAARNLASGGPYLPAITQSGPATHEQPRPGTRRAADGGAPAATDAANEQQPQR